VAVFGIAIPSEIHGTGVAGLSQRGKNSNGGEKVMQMERGTKLLKRVWKAVVWTELAALAGWLIFIFSPYFSYAVFMSNIHPQATAATIARRR